MIHVISCNEVNDISPFRLYPNIYIAYFQGNYRL